MRKSRRKVSGRLLQEIARLRISAQQRFDARSQRLIVPTFSGQIGSLFLSGQSHRRGKDRQLCSVYRSCSVLAADVAVSVQADGTFAAYRD